MTSDVALWLVGMQLTFFAWLDDLQEYFMYAWTS